jgi:capsular polysaccharide transport system permease protein
MELLPAYPDGLSSRIRIIRAIMFREFKSRYIGDKIGYAWSLVIPLVWIVLINFLFHLFGRRLPIDTDIGSFILSGIVPFIGFRYALIAGMRARLVYHNFFVLPRVSPEIVYCAVALLELVNTVTIYVILLIGNRLIYGYFEIDNLLAMTLGLVLSWLIGASLSYAIASVISNTRFAIRASQVVFRPMFYLSGVFFTANEIPQQYIKYIYFNPLLHAIEICRDGAFLSYHSEIAVIWMPVIFISVMIVIGIFASKRSGLWSPSDQEILL